MKSATEITERANELRDKYLAEMKNRYLCRLPINCAYNIRARVKGAGQVGFCKSSAILDKVGKRILVCNEDDMASRCQFFECRNTPETVEFEFEEIIKSPAKCGNDYPKLAVLIWVLQGEKIPESKLSYPKRILKSLHKLLLRR